MGVAVSYTVASNGVVSLDGRALVLPAASAKTFLAIVDALRPIVDANSARTGVPASWIYGIIWTETGFLGPKGGERAISPPDKDGTSAYGRMQLKPFWFSKAGTGIGDGVAHSNEEMLHDALNIRFGSDLLALIYKDGNDFVQASSIYNCGSESSKHPWRPHSAPPHEGRAAWGVCGNVAGDGLSYQDHAVAASNTFLLGGKAPSVGQTVSPPQWSFLSAAGASVATYFVVSYALKGLRS